MAKRSARKAAEAGQAESASGELDTSADAAERARAVQVAEDAAAAEVAATGDAGVEAGGAAAEDENGTATPDASSGTPDASSGTPNDPSGTPNDPSGTPSGNSSTPEASSGTPSDLSGVPRDGASKEDADDGGSAGPSGKEGPGEGSEAETDAPKPAKRRRAPKLDALLAADVDAARKALLEVAPQDQIGEHAGVKAEDDRVATHLFESHLPGYDGWQWFAVLTRVPRGKVATVSEVGLLPSERSVLAPEWVPWAKRVRPEEKQQAEADQAEEDANSNQESQSADK